MDPVWSFQLVVAVFWVVTVSLQIGTLEFRLKRIPSTTTKNELLRFRLIERHAGKIAAVGGVLILSGAAAIVSGHVLGGVPMALGQMIFWLAIVHRAFVPFIREPEGFEIRPFSNRRRALWLTAAVVAGAIAILLRADDRRALLWVIPMGLCATLAYLFMRRNAS